MSHRWKNLGDLVDRSRDLNRPAIIDLRTAEPRIWTHIEIDRLANGVASYLTGLGLARGTTVAILSLNRAEYIAAYFGIMRAGFVALPVNTKQPPETIEFVLSDSDSKFAFVDSASRKLLRKKRGSIVTMSSVVGLHGNLGQTNYAASKGGVIALTKALAKELGSRGIRVNCVAPGYITTELTDVLSDEIRDILLQQTPLGRLGEPDDIARTVRFLLSDDASFITGAVLSVDGGLGM